MGQIVLAQEDPVAVCMCLSVCASGQYNLSHATGWNWIFGTAVAQPLLGSWIWQPPTVSI